MGSYATGLDDNIANLFSGAFAQLSQTVIWKLNGDVSANLTPNVKVVDWMPQNDLLGKSYNCQGVQEEFHNSKRWRKGIDSTE